jgi:hypothetical protein
MHASGERTISDLAELFTISRPTAEVAAIRAAEDGKGRVPTRGRR